MKERFPKSGSFPSLKYPIDNCAGRKGKKNDERDVNRKVPKSQHGFQRAEIRYFCRGTGEHESRGGATAHSTRKPLEQKRNRSATANIEGNPRARGEQNSKALVFSEKRPDGLSGNITRKRGGKKNSHQKPGSRRTDVAPNVFQKTANDVRIDIAIVRFIEAGESEKMFVRSLFAKEDTDKNPGKNSA